MFISTFLPNSPDGSVSQSVAMNEVPSVKTADEEIMGPTIKNKAKVACKFALIRSNTGGNVSPVATDAIALLTQCRYRKRGIKKSAAGKMRGALVLLSLGSVAAFGGGKVIAGCLDPSASNYNTPGPVTLNISGMCLYAPAPPAPPMGPGRYGRVSALSESNPPRPPTPQAARTSASSDPLHYRRAGQGRVLHQ